MGGEICAFLGRPTTPDTALATARKAQTSLVELYGYLQELVLDRYLHSREDVISEMVTEVKTSAPAKEVDHLLREVMPVQLAALFVAGHEAVTHLLGNSLHTLFTHPSALEAMLADTALCSSAVDELARYDTSVQRVWRVVQAPTQVLGQQMRPGQLVCAIAGSANRDESRYKDAHLFQPGRRGPRVMSFGTGRHYCLGTQLGLLELSVALECVLTRFPKITPQVPLEQLQWLPSLSFRGLQSLPVSIR